MEFLVRTELRLPPGFDRALRAEMFQRERERGIELLETGVIKRIWRIPGRPYTSLAIHEAPDATALHANLSSLPLAEWLDIEVTALAEHPIESRTPIA